MRFHTLAIPDARDLVFGHAPHPVTTRRGLVLGAGTVYPELNFTLPPMQVCRETLPDVKAHYHQIVSEALRRARDLHAPGLVLEFETLLEMTMTPSIGVELVELMNGLCEEAYQKHGFRSEIRLTPNDSRDFDRPPRMRSSSHLDAMFELFERGAAAGGDLLSIESTGGKEVHDDALLMCDIKGVTFALAVLGVRDMRFLWARIVEVARRTGRIAGGDTACGFGNTAMVLAEKGFIPKVFAALVRVISVVRTLVAVEEGATGPDKDCGYEGPYLKAIAGIPISMEGKTAACAHGSPVGNVAAACADLWSNESVQNVKLLGGFAPTVYLEQLEYDTRFLNAAIRDGRSTVLKVQQLQVESDVHLDPQALVLAPQNVVAIAGEMVKARTYVEAARRGALRALDLIEAAIGEEALLCSEQEQGWLPRLREELNAIPDEESAFVEQMLPALDLTKTIPAEYGL
ncbi:MAG TPA: methyltransferase MtaB domain-containing protein [Anaeromyxobacter sp.]|nr:methyltransferase MtaB domain-containing protein [Anaeromyxobacter sp.]HVP59394.1 methyltransferase MtaB domain-containing protein [Myxococcaceae bacterium]